MLSSSQFNIIILIRISKQIQFYFSLYIIINSYLFFFQFFRKKCDIQNFFSEKQIRLMNASWMEFLKYVYFTLFWKTLHIHYLFSFCYYILIAAHWHWWHFLREMTSLYHSNSLPFWQLLIFANVMCYS